MQSRKMLLEKNKKGKYSKPKNNSEIRTLARLILNAYSRISTSKINACYLNRVSTKWINLLRKICAIFAHIFLRTFALFLRMKCNEFYTIFCAICAKPEIFFAQFAQNRKFFAKCNFLGILSKIDILSLEINN